MLCKSPYVVGGTVPVGCGQCLPCRINRRRLWSWRMYLESLCHEENSFLTLTYSKEELPDGGTLVPKHCVDWLKRYRKFIAPAKVRYYLVGEYGDQSQRPHYHAALFGVGMSYEEAVKKTWGKGHVMLAEFNQITAQYIAGYVTKKMTDKADPRLQGRYPEFARMSLNPGIGAAAMAVIADALHSDAGLDEIVSTGDVPSAVRVGGRLVPIGRYLRSKLRSEMGMPQRMVDEAKQQALLKWAFEVQDVFKDRLGSASAQDAVTVASAFVEKKAGKIASVEARSKLTRKDKL